MKLVTIIVWVALEGASLTVKLKYLESWNARRRAIAARYQSEIKNPKIKMQAKPNWSDGIYHLFVITTENKEAFVKHLEENEIVAAYHYPVPCHLQKAYAHLGYKQGDFPNSEYLAAHCISLPMFAELSDDAVTKVIETVNKY
jgi:dTDP-4-amino-4,6-dideoxygalactose transaminase